MRLHSHLGEGFAGDWAISKCRHMCFGRRFVWVTDCHAIRFILSYSGGNPAVLRLQMQLMGWDMDIVHRRDGHLIDADYWSRIDADLCYDPLLRRYLQSSAALARKHPAPSSLPIEPQHMPYFRGPRIRSDNSNETPETSSAVEHPTTLAIVPVHFGHFDSMPDSHLETPRALYHSDITRTAFHLSTFRWAVYSFNSGHFISTIRTRNLSFSVHYACDPHASGRSLFAEFGSANNIFSTGHEFLNHIRAAGDTTPLHGYLIHSHRFSSTDPTTKFWQLQSAIVEQLYTINQLSMVVAVVHPDHDGRSVSQFSSRLSQSGWHVSTTTLRYTDFGDSIVDSTSVILAVHSGTTASASCLQLKQPPAVPPRPLSEFTWPPFNTSQYSVSYAPDDKLFNSDTSSPLSSVAAPTSLTTTASLLAPKYSLHPANDPSPTLSGAIVYDSCSLCPPFQAGSTHNIFQHYFGIEFILDGHTHVRPFSPFEFASCFGLEDDITYKLAHPSHAFTLDAGVPGNTSAWLFEQVSDRLIAIRDSNTEIFAPAEFNDNTSICALADAATSKQLPSQAQWAAATDADDELRLVKEFTLTPSLITNTSLSSVNYNYRSALRKSLISCENGTPIAGGWSYTRLRIVPSDFYNIIFISFHTNAAGGHLNAYRTMHRIRLRFYWPHMFKYITRMCKACPGCALANPT